MAHFFTSDTHIKHRKILIHSRRHIFLSDAEKKMLVEGVDFAPSDESVSRMEDAIVNNINRFVGENDTLWHLGDVGWFNRDKVYEEGLAFRKRIRCKNVNLIFGNHDPHALAGVFNASWERYRLRYERHKIILSHYAQAVWQGSHNGAIHLYGHSHSTAEEWLDTHMPNRRSLDVGIDNAYRLLGEYRPFSFDDDIEPILRDKIGCSIDCHRPKQLC